MQARISATIPPDLKDFLVETAERTHQNQSDVLEIALKMLQQHSVSQKMKEGYQKEGREAELFAEGALKITSLRDEM